MALFWSVHTQKILIIHVLEYFSSTYVISAKDTVPFTVSCTKISIYL